MTAENKDPYECQKCGTVNAWNQELCRSCGESRETSPSDEFVTDSPPALNEEELTAAAPDAAIPHLSSTVPAPRRRWNAFWIFLGIAIHVVSIHLGVFSIIKVFIEPDPQLKTTIEQTLAAAKEGDTEKASILDNLPETMKSKLSAIRWILILLLLAAPFFIGAATGYFARTVLEGAASMGLSAVLIPVLNGAAEFAILWGPINAGIGALGAYVGYKASLRLRPSASPADQPHRADV